MCTLRWKGALLGLILLAAPEVSRAGEPEVFSQLEGTPETLTRGTRNGIDGYFVTQSLGPLVHVPLEGGEAVIVDDFGGWDLLISDRFPFGGTTTVLRAGIYGRAQLLNPSTGESTTFSVAPLGNLVQSHSSFALIPAADPNDFPKLLLAIYGSEGENASLWFVDHRGLAVPLDPTDTHTYWSVRLIPDQFGSWQGWTMLSAIDGSLWIMNPHTLERKPFGRLAQSEFRARRGRQVGFSPVGWAADLDPDLADERVLALSVTFSGDSLGPYWGQLQLIDSTGRVLAVLAAPDAEDGFPEEFDPRGVAFVDGAILVAERASSSIVKYSIDEFVVLDCGLGVGSDASGYEFVDDLGADCNGDGLSDACHPYQSNRRGDADGDGIFTLKDFADFQRCFAGTGTVAPCGCEQFDSFADENSTTVDIESYIDLFYRLHDLQSWIDEFDSCYWAPKRLDQQCQYPGSDGCIEGCVRDFDGDGLTWGEDECLWGNDFKDQDFDGTPDACDVAPFDPLGDRDLDGIGDSVDPCPCDPLNRLLTEGACVNWPDCVLP